MDAYWLAVLVVLAVAWAVLALDAAAGWRLRHGGGRRAAALSWIVGALVGAAAAVILVGLPALALRALVWLVLLLAEAL